MDTQFVLPQNLEDLINNGKNSKGEDYSKDKKKRIINKIKDYVNAYKNNDLLECFNDIDYITSILIDKTEPTEKGFKKITNNISFLNSIDYCLNLFNENTKKFMRDFQIQNNKNASEVRNNKVDIEIKSETYSHYSEDDNIQERDRDIDTEVDIEDESDLFVYIQKQNIKILKLQKNLETICNNKKIIRELNEKIKNEIK